MHAGRSAVLLIFCALGLSACAAPSAFPPPEPTADQSWTMRLTQTGGFAGVQLVVHVSSAGELKAEDQRTGRSVTVGLPPGELHELGGQLEALTSQPPARLPSGCADCFIYDLEVASATGTIRVQADDTTLAASGAQALIEHLRRLRDEALSSVT